MKEYIEELTKHVTEQFGRTAQDYLTAGFDVFHRCLDGDSDCGQASVGMLSAGIELLIKSYLAERNLGNVFTKMPQDVRLYLANPETVPRFYTWRTFSFDIGSDRFKPLSFSETLDSFYVFFPHMKQLLVPYIADIARMRYGSLHSIVPSLTPFDISRVGYAVLSTARVIFSDDTFSYGWYSLSDYDNEYLKQYEMRRRERVMLAIEKAKQYIGESSEDQLQTAVSRDWNSYVAVCPVCRAAGLLRGYTEMAMGEDEEGPYPSLDFFSVSYYCEQCQLTLYDYEELRLAGMNTLFDRTKDLDKWFRERGDYLDID